jgi:glucoamylase
MVKFRNQSQAFGSPGSAPRWTHTNKDGIGTAYFTASRTWFTVCHSVVTEVYYPTVDRPQIRDLQYLISDDQSFFHEEKRDLNSKTERMWSHGFLHRIRDCYQNRFGMNPTAPKLICFWDDGFCYAVHVGTYRIY